MMGFDKVFCKNCGSYLMVIDLNSLYWNYWEKLKKEKEIIYKGKKTLNNSGRFYPQYDEYGSLDSFYSGLEREGIAQWNKKRSESGRKRVTYSYEDTITLKKDDDLFVSIQNEVKDYNKWRYPLYSAFTLREGEYCHCPVCNEKLTESNAFYCSNGAEVNIDSNNRLIVPENLKFDQKSKKSSVTGDMFKEFCEIIEQRDIKKEVDLMIENQQSQIKYNFSNVSVTDDSLLDYLKNLVQLESNLYFCYERYKKLRYEKLKFDREYVRTKKKLMNRKSEMINADQTRLRQNLNELDDKYAFMCFDRDFSKFGIDIPIKPEPPKTERPSEPILKKSNIFNKNRVERENDQLMLDYHAKLSEYNSLIEDYNRNLAFYEKEYNDYCEQCKKIEEIETDRIKSENALIEKKKNEEKFIIVQQIEKNDEDLNNIETIIENDTRLTVLKMINDLVSNELRDVEILINKINECRKEYYSRGIIYPKYCNLIALSTITEYLITGRCNNLVGSDGAYNLYENELRANRIIGQLDKVIDSLEAIKENQYYTYQRLCSIEGKLCSLNSKMEKAVNSLNESKNVLNEINKNTEMIAYNTEATAYYSKLNAQLTDALGYMVAFK